MVRKLKLDTKKAAESLKEVLSEFGNTMGEILDDPAVKEKAKEFAESLLDAAAKVADSKVEKEKVRTRFRNAGKAMHSLGSSLEEHFQN